MADDLPFPTDKPHVLLLGNIEHPASQAAFEALRPLCHIITPTSTSREQFLTEATTPRLSHVSIILRTFASVSITGPIDLELLRTLPNLRYVAHNGAGYDQINIPACNELGIQVSNVLHQTDNATAETNVFLLLGAFRGYWAGMRRLRTGGWVGADVPLGHDLTGKTLGIVGLGGIGKAVARRVKPFGVKVIYYSRNRAQDEEGAEYVDFETLLKSSDAISLNLPLNPHTRHLISTEQFGLMKRGVIILNTARGPVIDEAALVAALESGQVGGAGLDVYENEPKVHAGLVGRDDVILLPHMGTYTHETQEKMELWTVSNVRSVLETGALRSRVGEQEDVDFKTALEKRGLEEKGL